MIDVAFLDGSVKSEVLGMRTGISLVLPFDINERPRADFPIIYLLHGLSDDHTCWWRYTSVERYANQRGFILVMPEVQRSFYTDMDKGLDYFTFISQELPTIIERLIGYKHRRENTFVAGLSMGGYGALKCGFSRPEFYGGCAGFSPALDKSRLYQNNDVMTGKEIVGIFGNSLKHSDDVLVLSENLVNLKADMRPKIYTSCGFDDFVYNDFLMLKSKLDSLNIKYKAEEWSGNHEWGFWDTSIQHAMDYFLNDI